MAMVVESCSRVVVRHTFLELVEEDAEVSFAPSARRRAFSEPRTTFGAMEHFEKCDVDLKSTGSTQANDTDDDTMWSDEEEAPAPVQAPPGILAAPGVWAAPVAAPAAAPQFMPVHVAFVPVVQQQQQPIWKKSSRSARRRRARAMNKWFRHQQNGEQDEEDAEFDDDWQVPECDDMAESPAVDVESWPMPNLPCEVHDKKAIKA